MSRTPNPERLVYVINSLRAGGAERQLVRIASGLQRSGRWDVSVYCLARIGIFIEELERIGIQVAGPDQPWGESPARLTRSFFDLRRYLAREKPSVVHCFLDHANILGSVAAWAAGVPHVITTRLCVDQYRGRRLLQHRLTLPVTDRLSDRVFAVCAAARDQAVREGTSANKAIIVPNSVESPKEKHPRRGVFRGSPIFGSVGEVHPRKGYGQLVEAMPTVLAALPDARFIVVGGWKERSGLELERLQRRADELGVSSHIEFLGIREDVPELLPEFDVFVMPSVIEGMPNALMEAMAAGLPAVATSVGGVPELISDGVNGCLVKPGSSEDLASALIMLGSNSDLRIAFGNEARLLMANQYSSQREMEENEQAYLDLLHSRAGTPSEPEPASTAP